MPDLFSDVAPARCSDAAPPWKQVLPGAEPKVVRDELVAAAEWVSRYLSELPAGSVSRPMRAEHRARLREGSLAPQGAELGRVLDFVRAEIAPYPSGNGHPAFFAWVNSPPAPAGLIAELLAGAVNATCGMGENALMDLERGTVRTLAGLAGLPDGTGGVLTSGGSMANLLALATARSWFLTRRGSGDGPDYDRDHARLTLYYSAQAHMSVSKAAACIGVPAHRLRPVPADAQDRLDPDALRAAVAADTDAGFLPFCTVSTLGTTATGAVDPLEAVTSVCRGAGMWHHADGAWGGLGAAVPALAPLYRGVGDVDSLTVDPHKTLSVPVGCGALLVPDPGHLHTAFAHRASYLTAGETDALPWLSHSTVELTRPGTRALALWATLNHLGRDGVTALIEHYLTLAARLRDKITADPRLELLAGGPWPAACFRVTDVAPDDADALHTRVARRIQEGGRAYLATVEVRGRTVLRACVCNYRTTTDDLDVLLGEVAAAVDADRGRSGRTDGAE
ncbi:aminotransferase class V-fold PLP-dependent enzyme [Streptomyces sp. VRA16 Mangrove soil]|uniref:pyridoxal phosphate-dependent decarboxylase family protein n=1 Tax=Streptomyces sp. VRA16 Mangrove soil TaxID=2817434 RepID=UPI001A9D40FE|nr:pyridoxal-dependent decarboxylase [Streptomyces sp. VRA16 Mangrove soil]MBO1333288.1 aminotransferase class V-fold PLP-dependent enzyme [Streptomyces sp. VRA16 Mangrove soil]